MKKSLKVMIFLLVTVLVTGLFSGCGSAQNSGDSGAVSGSITAAGSTALQPLAEQAAAAFKNKYPEATVNVQGGGSGNGLTQVAQGTVEIGNSDIFANEKAGIESAALVDHKVAVVGFAVVTNKNVKIDNLTKQQLIDIFTGKITNWNQVGGDNMKISVINRPKSSGTRATFKKYALDGNDEVEGLALTEDSSGSVKKVIQTTEGAIGYLALPYLTEDVKKDIKVFKLDGVEANKENITSDKYKVWSYEHMYTKGEPAGLTKAFLDFMVGNDAKSIVENLGYIPVSDMKVQR